MLDSKIVSGGNCVGALVERVAWRADGESPDVPAQLGDGPANQAGVHAARQQSSYRNVGLETQLHCLQENALGLIHGFLKRDLAIIASLVGLPVSAPALVALREFDDSGGRHLVDVFINC